METQDIELLRQRLLREKKRILKGRNKLLNRPKSGYDIADKAAELSEELVLSNLSNNDARTLRQIEEAFKRIDAGNYGICESCGVEISMRRLRILPYTTHCIQCQADS